MTVRIRVVNSDRAATIAVGEETAEGESAVTILSPGQEREFWVYEKRDFIIGTDSDMARCRIVNVDRKGTLVLNLKDTVGSGIEVGPESEAAHGMSIRSGADVFVSPKTKESQPTADE